MANFNYFVGVIEAVVSGMMRGNQVLLIPQLQLAQACARDADHVAAGVFHASRLDFDRVFAGSTP
jgi:hypothetical protein